MVQTLNKRRRRNKTKRGGMDRIKNMFTANKIDDLIEKSETQDLENQSLRSKQDVVFNMVSDLEKRSKFPDNMAMFAGPGTNTILPRFATSEYVGLYNNNTYDAKYLSSFPYLKKFDILRFVIMHGGILVNDTKSIQFPEKPKHAPWTHNHHLFNSAGEYFSMWISVEKYNNSENPYKIFIDNIIPKILELNNKYIGLFEDPTIIQIGTITQIGTTSDARYPRVPVPLMFPNAYKSSTYWKKILDDFVKKTEEHNKIQQQAYQHQPQNVIKFKIDFAT